MLRLSWSKDVLGYLERHEGQINDLELAFANFRKSPDGLPVEGIIVEISYRIYIWKIHDHLIRLRHIPGGSKLHIRVEAIRRVK